MLIITILPLQELKLHRETLFLCDGFITILPLQELKLYLCQNRFVLASK